MSDGVKFIFMTLIKVPCIIFTAFIIFNVFAFFFIYFKILGFSYVVMQEVVENNYISTTQMNQLYAQFSDIDSIPLASNTKVIIGEMREVGPGGDTVTTLVSAKKTSSDYKAVNASDGSSVIPLSNNDSALYRRQYGAIRTVGVHCDYIIVWPLSYNHAAGLDEGVEGLKNNEVIDAVEVTYDKEGDKFKDNMGESDVVENGFKVKIPLNIYYTVPGLKYYADLTS